MVDKSDEICNERRDNDYEEVYQPFIATQRTKACFGYRKDLKIQKYWFRLVVGELLF